MTVPLTPPSRWTLILVLVVPVSPSVTLGSAFWKETVPPPLGAVYTMSSFGCFAAASDVSKSHPLVEPDWNSHPKLAMPADQASKDGLTSNVFPAPACGSKVTASANCSASPSPACTPPNGLLKKFQLAVDSDQFFVIRYMLIRAL